jgi:flagellar hook-basal body complex protein FliE
MALANIAGLQPIRFPVVAAPGAASGQPATPFASVIRDAVQQVQTLENNATQTVDGLLSGSGVDIHTAIMATQKADLAFEMALSFRNKAVSAYQQLMSTQF